MLDPDPHKTPVDGCGTVPEKWRYGVDIADEHSNLADADSEGEGAHWLVARGHHRNWLQKRDNSVLNIKKHAILRFFIFIFTLKENGFMKENTFCNVYFWLIFFTENEENG